MFYKHLKFEIKTDKIFSRVLFTEAKKRYAGLLPDGTLDVVGFEAVRGDWSEAAKTVQEKVLELVLKDNTPGRAVGYVRGFIANLKDGRLPLSELVVWKTLTKPVEEYKVRAPHVEVARKLRREGWRLTVGDKVGYIVTKGPGKLYEKAEPYMMVSGEDVDFDYYVQSQIMPASLRILEMFGVTDKQLLSAEKPSLLVDFMK